jgi:hypothetical protein
MDFRLFGLPIKFLLSLTNVDDERDRVVDRVKKLNDFLISSDMFAIEDYQSTKFENMIHANGKPGLELQFVENEENSDPYLCTIISPKYITNADVCLYQILKYLYVIRTSCNSVAYFLDESNGIYYDYLDLLIRLYLKLLLAEGPIVLDKDSEKSFEDSKGCAYMLLKLMQNSSFLDDKIDDEDDDDSRCRIEKSLSSLLRHTYDTLLQKCPGALCILYCAKFQKRNIEDRRFCSDVVQIYEDFEGDQTIPSVHGTIIFQSPDFLKWFPNYLGLERVLFLLEILLKRVREQDPPYTSDQKKMVFSNICTFLIKHFPKCGAMVEMTHLLSIQETERIYPILKSLGLTMPRD